MTIYPLDKLVRRSLGLAILCVALYLFKSKRKCYFEIQTKMKKKNAKKTNKIVIVNEREREKSYQVKIKD